MFDQILLVLVGRMLETGTAIPIARFTLPQARFGIKVAAMSTGPLAWVFGVAFLAVLATDPSASGEKLPPSAQAAWAALQEQPAEDEAARAIVGRRLSGEERARWRAQLLGSRVESADLAAEFRRRFPADTNTPAALRLEAERLILAGDVAMAQDSNVVERLHRVARELVQEARLSERSRSQLAAALLNRAVYARYNCLENKTDVPAFQDEEIASTRFLIESFPERAEFWQQLAMQAGLLDPEKARPVVGEILAGAPAGAGREIAQGLKWKLDAVGQPFDLAFTAFDGTKVATAAWKGKVVLIDFWATWCAPCVAALPDLRKVYQKYHPKDLELIGISLDTDSAALKRFLAKYKDPWPQHFDGKSWQSPVAYQHGVQSIPSLWLLDRNGMLRTMDAHHDLHAQLAKWIAEP